MREGYNGKIEIVDNQVMKFYELHVYEFRKKHWYSRKATWCLYFSQYISYKFMCPEIHKGLIDAKGYFEREVKQNLEDYPNITVIHNIIMTQR